MKNNYQIYHKHTSLSNVYTKDSPLIPKDYWNYFKDNCKCQPQIYNTMEHGWQGNYFKIYDDLISFNNKYSLEYLDKEKNIKNKDFDSNFIPIKFIFGSEIYWVKDRLEKDNANCHMVLIAKNENGRKAINKAISIANKTGYYYKPRLDLELILNLPKDDIFVTSACIGFWNNYSLSFEDEWEKYKEIDKIMLKLNNHFSDFYLEVQANITDKQKELNKHIINLSEKYNIPIIAGTDTHVIEESQMKDRDDLLKSSGINYPEEDGWFMDIPTYDEFVNRFKEQGILSEEQIFNAIDNTNIFLDFDDIKLDRSLKVPILKKYQHLTQDERNKIFKDLLKEQWNLQLYDIDKDKIKEYYKEIKHDIGEIIGCGMTDYFLFNYEVMKLGQEKYGGILTPTGRGSAVGMFLSKLLGFTKVDKINSDILMYSERFLTKERVLDSKCPPDVDHNVSSREPFILAQKELLGENGAYDLIALGTLHYKSAFKMYARAYNLNPQIANDVTRQITKYENALKYADDDEKEYIDIFSYVDEELYGDLINGCQQYLGIIDNRKGHPCGTIAYDGDVESDIGIILCKSETTKKEVLTAIIESGTIDSFGFLKQDYLIVDSIGLTYSIYNEIGIEPYTVNQLLKIIKDDKKVWDIYRNGYTMCINQAEQEKSTQKVMCFNPKNIYELTQWIAGIRPSFQTMYKTFERREHFDYGIKALDSLLQDNFCDSSFLIFQEQLMLILGFAGFKIGETYTIIKAISKKKDYIIKAVKPKFIKNFAKAILETKETTDENKAEYLADEVWKIVENSASYGFNCVNGDTRINRGSKNGKFEPTVKEMYEIMNGINKDHKALTYKYKTNGYGMALSMYDDFKVRENRIIDITPSGIRQTYEVVTSTGKSIICTDNHKFPTINGEVELKNLKVGDSLYCMGRYQHTKFDSSLTDGNFENNVPKKGETGFQKRENGSSVKYEKFRNSCVKNKVSCEICNKRYLKMERFEIHHKDLNRKNNEIINFQWLCASCHKKEHYNKGRTKKYEKGIPTYLDKIISISPYKIEQTYNVEMSEPYHNFISENGLITSNSAHAYCMAIDSVTLAYLKAHYPLEFYKVVLQRFTDKGEKDKVALIKKEMTELNIKLRPIKFREDNRKFFINKEEECIYQTMSSIKNISKITPNALYKIRKMEFNHALNLFVYLLEETKLNKTDITILIKLNYFEEFGNINYLLYLYEKFQDRYKKTLVQNSKEKRIIELLEFDKTIKNIETKLFDKLSYELSLIGYSNLIDSNIDGSIYGLSSLEQNQWGTTFAKLYNVQTGFIKDVKVDKKYLYDNPLEVGDIIKCAFKVKEKKRKSLDENGEEIINKKGYCVWVGIGEYEEIATVWCKYTE